MIRTRAALGLLTLALAAPPAEARPQDPVAPEGFQVRRAVGTARSYLSLHVAADGALLAGTERSGLWRLWDGDGDGFLEQERCLDPELLGIQGLTSLDGALFAVGRREDTSALWRLEQPGQGEPISSRTPLVRFGGDDEHGAHGVVAGLDGRLYLVHGDAVQPLEEPTKPRTFAVDEPPTLLPPLPDPGGFGRARRWPYGQVLSVDPTSGAYEAVAVGLRNPYDLALRSDGEWFTVESDMEWDLGLPWYRPVRALLLQRRGDYGARPGSAPLRAGWPDTPPALAELGRGSPTGLAFVEHRRWPAQWQGRLLVGDWLEGQVYGLELTPEGAGYRAERVPFLGGGRALPVTDLELDAGGTLWLATGGRGTAGSVFAVAPPLGEQPFAASPEDRALLADQPLSAPGRARLGETLREGGDALAQELRALAEDPVAEPAQRQAATRALLLGDRPRAQAWAMELSLPSPAALDPGSLRLLLDAFPQSPVARAALDGDPGPHLRRAFERSDSPGARPHQVLARSRDPWLLYARRPFVPAAVAGGRDDTQLLHKNDWWFEQHLQRPTFTSAEESLDLVSFLWLDLPLEDRVRQLRTAQLLLASGVRLDPRVEPNLDERLKRLLQEDEPRLVELAVPLVAWRATRQAPELLLELLERTPSRSLAIDAATGLHALLERLDTGQRARLLAFHEEAADWTGGGSFEPTLAALRAALVDATPDDQLRELAAAGQLGGRALAAALAARPALAADLAPALGAAWQAWEADEELEPAALLSRQRGLLRSLAGGGAALAPLAPWLRAQAEAHPRLDGEVLGLLAELGQEQDRPALAQGLLHGRFEVREACAAALLAADWRPAKPGPVWGALRQARDLGPRTGARVARVAARWLQATDPEPGATGARWSDELARLEGVFAERFPGWTPPAPGPLDGARYTPEQLAGFLARTAHRPASPARGGVVYSQLGCDACHVLGGLGGGWGPPLDGVTRRLDPDALLRSLLEPSAEVADRYASSRVTLIDGALHEGRLAQQDDQRLELWLPAGTRLELPRRDVVAVEPSELSPMPAGLLDGVPLEAVRDLFAYLAADGQVTPEDAAGAAWIDLFANENRANWGGTLAGWRLVGDVLEGTAEDLPRSTYLVYQRPFTDFEVEFDVFAPDANSGLQYRSALDPDKPDPVGYQADVGKAWWGSLFATDGRGALAQPERILLKDGVHWQGWNHYYLRVQGDRHVIELNGNPMVDVRDDAHRTGLFALQLHQKMKMQVWFTNLRVRPL